MKNPLLILIFLLALWIPSLAQDGSDIRYFKIAGVDSSLIGQFVHLDFYRRSFGGRNIDTVTIIFDNRPVRFIENRKDNGYDNWFSQQSFQAIDNIDGLTMKIIKFRLDSLKEKTIQVTMFIDFYDVNNKLISGRSIQPKYWFDKNIITEVLVKSPSLPIPGH